MLGIAAELENVPLSDAHVLEEPPRREGLALGALASQCDGQAGDGLSNSTWAPRPVSRLTTCGEKRSHQAWVILLTVSCGQAEF